MTLALLIGITIFGAFIDGLPDWLVQRRHYLPSDPAVVSLKTWGEWFWSVHPGFHCGTLAEGGYLSLPVARSAAVHLGIGTGFFILSLLLFERFCGSESAYASEGGGRSRRWRWLGRPRRARRLAFVWKDFHFGMGGRLSVAIRLVFYITGALFLTWINREMDGGVTSERHLLAEIGFGFGITAWYFEIAVLALLVWGPEAWGQHIGAVVATPRSLRRLNLEKARAGLIATLPSVTLVVLSLVVGGSQFIGEIFLGDQDYSARGPGGIPYNLWRWISVLKWLAQFGVLVALIVNFSLRLKWTALPAAAGIFCAGLLSYELLSFRRAFARGFGRQTMILEAFAVIFVCGLLIYFIGRNTHSLLLRRAAEG